MQRAEALLVRQPATLPPLIAAALGLRDWIEAGETRPATRSATIRYRHKRQIFRVPVPLTGAASLGSEQNWDREDWLPAFLQAIEREAADGRDLLYTMACAWFEAGRSIAGRRRDSHATAAVDLLAAATVPSATTLARMLGVVLNSAIRILDELLATGITIEVTHRPKRRRFGLRGLTPLRRAGQPPSGPTRTVAPADRATTSARTKPRLRRRNYRRSRRSNSESSTTPRSTRRWRISMRSSAHPDPRCVHSWTARAALQRISCPIAPTSHEHASVNP